MKCDLSKIYDNAVEFLNQPGVSLIMLTRSAAQDVCALALGSGLMISRIEGGIWRNPGFESRLDCIWDGLDPPASTEQARMNNEKARAFVATTTELHNVFIITTSPLSGWWHEGHHPVPGV